jgi:16S rRNA (adenine1518-N6/adenine1519-N6)-dimethyltransferase
MHTDWTAALGAGHWSMVSNLPYNVSVPLVLDLLETAPIDRYVVMVQREVGERLVAGPWRGGVRGGERSGRVSGRRPVLRRVPADGVLAASEGRLGARPAGPPRARRGRGSAALFAIVDEGFAERRKTMANALRRLGRDAGDAAEILRAVDPDPSVRAERLGLDAFAAIARSMLERGWTP